MVSLLTFDPRLYDLMRQTAITTIPEGLVEMDLNKSDNLKKYIKSIKN